MNPSRSWIALLVLSSITAPIASHAQGAHVDFAHYALAEGSTFATGCFGPCDCPVRETPASGEFELEFTGSDPLYQNYDVVNVKWTVPEDGHTVTITGSGRYRIGGEVALVQQMTLDLSLDGQPPLRFDSGVVPGGGGFPKIDVTISLHERQACLDTAIHVVASPATAGIGSTPLPLGLGRVQPNPFFDRTRVQLVTAGNDPLEVRVYDALGRRVRTLTGAASGAGAHWLEWNGLDMDGAECAAGVYFVGARVNGLEYRREVVKLR
jgi:hypothetical protein